MAVSEKGQTALDERVVENSVLEKMLEDREVAKGGAGEARKKFTAIDDLAKSEIGKLNLDDDEAVRVGRFRVAKTAVAGRSVAFDVEPSVRLRISTAEED